MKIVIQFSTDNDAFTEDQQSEVDRILDAVVRKIKQGYDSGPIMDANGNRVGSFSVDEEDQS